MSKYKEEVIKLRSKGLTYAQIAKQLNCSTCTVCYYLDPTQKSKRQIRRHQKHPYIRKLEFFSSRRQNTWKAKHQERWAKIMHNKVSNFGKGNKVDFTYHDVVKKFGDKPKCYLTGQEIDIYQPSTYNFDHIVATARGGDNSLNNLGICTRNANQAKSDMNLEEFKNMCKMVLENFGYNIEPPK